MESSGRIGLISITVRSSTKPAFLDLPKLDSKSLEPSLTRVRSVQQPGLAVEALQHVARYDSMRLETYRQKENLTDRSTAQYHRPACLAC
jgi:hypothetical protein